MLRHDLKWSRVVSVLGMRQAGKTTLLRQVADSYLTLDDPEVAAAFDKGDWTALETQRIPLAIDEAQLRPALFPEIKIRADQLPKPGRYILTGSVRFLSKKQIRESLTGRTSILELLPLTLAEAHSRPQGELIRIALEKSPHDVLRLLKREAWCSTNQAEAFLESGGMPGVCFRRDPTIRRRAWSAHLDTVLSRDLQLLVATRVSLPTLRDLFSELARTQGEPVNQAALARRAGVSAPTLKQLLRGFEGLFLIRAHGKTYYCEDPGLATYAAGGLNVLSSRANLLRLCFFELHAQLRYQFDPGSRMTEFRTRGGAHAPFVIEVPGKGRLGIGVDPGPVSTDKTLRSLTTLAKARPGTRVLAIHQGQEAYLSPRAGTPCIPWTWIF